MLSAADAFHRMEMCEPVCECGKGWDNPTPPKPVGKGANLFPLICCIIKKLRRK